jgi:tripartite-type tricarboxylate transporter receptor subunit TctC
MHALSLVAVTLACLIAPPSLAQTYPNRPVRLIAPFPPGGYTDIVARLIAPKLGEILGQSVIVENRGGAGGNVGSEVVAKAQADGYTLLIGGPWVAIGPSLYGARLGYDTSMLAPLGMLADFPNLLVVNAASGAASLKALIEDARARPGKLNYASNGAGTTTHLTAELFKRETKTFIVHIPYRSAQAGQVAVMQGDAAFYFNNVAPALPLVRSGRLRALAITSAKRSPQLPDVPTMAEAGLPGVEVSAFLGLMTTAGTPEPILAQLESAVERLVGTPETVAGLERQGGFPQFLKRRAFADFIANETRKWTAAVKYSGASPD